MLDQDIDRHNKIAGVSGYLKPGYRIESSRAHRIIDQKYGQCAALSPIIRAAATINIDYSSNLLGIGRDTGSQPGVLICKKLHILTMVTTSVPGTALKRYY